MEVDVLCSEEDWNSSYVGENTVHQGIVVPHGQGTRKYDNGGT